MKRRRRGPDQIIGELREADAMLGTGTSIDQMCQRLAISEQTFHLWRIQSCGMKAQEAMRLKQLEFEYRRLRRLAGRMRH